MSGAGRLVALTGATGFIGRHLATDLRAHGLRVRLLLRRPAAGLPDADSVVIGDIARPLNLAKALEGVDTVIHSAGLAHAMSGRPEDDYRVINPDATLARAQAARRARVRRFLFLSSVRAQTGPSAVDVLDESSPPQPTDAYGRSKLAAERMLGDLDIDWAALRPVVVHGAGAVGNIALLLQLARSPWPLPIGSLTGRRSLVAVETVASALRFLMAHPDRLGRPFLVADPGPLTVGEMVGALREGFGRSAQILSFPEAILALSARLGGRGALYERLAGNLVVEPKALAALGWQASRTARDGLVEFAKQHRP